jgi:hypothetical protein
MEHAKRSATGPVTTVGPLPRASSNEALDVADLVVRGETRTRRLQHRAEGVGRGTGCGTWHGAGRGTGRGCGSWHGTSAGEERRG